VRSRARKQGEKGITEKKRFVTKSVNRLGGGGSEKTRAVGGAQEKESVCCPGDRILGGGEKKNTRIAGRRGGKKLKRGGYNFEAVPPEGLVGFRAEKRGKLNKKKKKKKIRLVPRCRKRTWSDRKKKGAVCGERKKKEGRRLRATRRPSRKKPSNTMLREDPGGKKEKKSTRFRQEWVLLHRGDKESWARRKGGPNQRERPKALRGKERSRKKAQKKKGEKISLLGKLHFPLGGEKKRQITMSGQKNRKKKRTSWTKKGLI